MDHKICPQNAFRTDLFVEITGQENGIVIDIRYATKENFAQQQLYTSPRLFLRKRVAEKLLRVQQQLQTMGLGLKVYDGYRPLSVQKLMWKVTPDKRYVADPAIGSKHNRGAAVDVTLVNLAGEELLMPTPFDHFSPLAHRDCTELSSEAIANRSLLESVMIENGFLPLPTEWWHFNDSQWEQYPVEDLSFEELDAQC